MKIVLEMEEVSARLLMKVLDFYCRVGIGQFNEIVNHPTFDKHLVEEACDDNKTDWEKYHKDIEEANKKLVEAKSILMGNRHGINASYGIHNESVDDTCRAAFDMQQIIRHELWKSSKHPTNRYSNASAVYLTGKLPPIKCKINEKD